MNYPFWDIPILGSGWVIGIIAIFHVMISQFAVGGGLYLPMAERKAQRMTDPGLRAAWHKQLISHSKFFLILTVPKTPVRIRHGERRGHLVRHRPHAS
jgi:cytochrome d ubiquinol oxidase subunit I